MNLVLYFGLLGHDRNGMTTPDAACQAVYRNSAKARGTRFALWMPWGMTSCNCQESVMKQLAIIPRDQRDIVHELEGCIERLEDSGIQVYATHRGQGYGILWAEDSAFSVLTCDGFKVAPLTRRSN